MKKRNAASDTALLLIAGGIILFTLIVLSAEAQEWTEWTEVPAGVYRVEVAEGNFIKFKPDDSTPVEPPVDECDGSFEINDVINWDNPPSQLRIDLPQYGAVVSSFISTDNPAYKGQISVASTTGNSGVSREVWVSECPGGNPVTDKCIKQGTSSTVIHWTQGDASYECPLELNTQYYINYENINCTQSYCDVYRNIYTN